MSCLQMSSREFTRQFIELYKSYPELWKVKSPEYRDRDQKAKAYEVLVRKLREVEPKANKNLVVRKVNSIRSTYRREVRKLEIARQKGGNKKPKLWYYHMLNFLNDDTNDETYDEDQDQPQDEEPAVVLPKIESVYTCSLLSPSPSLASSRSSIITRNNKHHHESRAEQNDINVPQDVENQRTDQTLSCDKFDYMTKSWAETIRGLPWQQQVFATKLINDVLFEAQLNTLNRQSCLIATSTSSHSFRDKRT